jgi:hypothetical protein
MRKLDPAGRPLGPAAYVFGTVIGKRTRSVRGAWEEAREKAGLEDLQLRDLWHETGSRFDEAGRIDPLREQAAWTREPQHNDALSQHPAARPALGDGEVGGKSEGRGRGAAEESGGTRTQECGTRCTTVARDR